MKSRHGPWRMLAGLGLTLATLSGCQTWVPTTGQTLPSPRYLEHPPQYFAPSPAFPLSRELESQQRAAAALPDPGAPPAVPLPPAVPAPAAPNGGAIPLPPPPGG